MSESPKYEYMVIYQRAGWVNPTQRLFTSRERMASFLAKLGTGRHDLAPLTRIETQSHRTGPKRLQTGESCVKLTLFAGNHRYVK